MTAKRKRTLNILILLTLAFIWGNSLQGPETSMALSDAVRTVLALLLPGIGAGGGSGWGSFLIRKAAHFSEFCLLGFLLRSRAPEVPARVLLLGLLAALADESIQYFTGRTSLVFDIWLDFGGVAAGALALYALRRRLKNSA